MCWYHEHARIVCVEGGWVATELHPAAGGVPLPPLLACSRTPMHPAALSFLQAYVRAPERGTLSVWAEKRFSP